jgi:hypothetical protein
MRRDVINLDRRLVKVEAALGKLLEASGATPQENPFFGLFGSKRKTARKSGGREKEYSAVCVNKYDGDDDIHPVTTFRAPNKTEAKAKVKKWLSDRGDDPRDFTIDLEEY